MSIQKTNNEGRIRHGKPWWKRWSRDDTELFILSLPTLLWFLIFSYLPMFGIIIAFKNYKLQPGGHGFIVNELYLCVLHPNLIENTQQIQKVKTQIQNAFTISTTCCTVTGRDLEISNISLHPIRLQCCCATRFSTILLSLLLVQALQSEAH